MLMFGKDRDCAVSCGNWCVVVVERLYAVE